MKIKHVLAATVSFAALGGFVAPASAQDAAPARASEASSEAQMGEIIVTARRRAEDVSKIPVAVTVFSHLPLGDGRSR